MWRSWRLSLLLLGSMSQSCTLPSANVGRPVAPGRTGLGLSAGYSIGDASYEQRNPNPGDDYNMTIHSSTSQPEGFTGPGSATLGVRAGLTERVDVGFEIGFGHVGLNTRVGIIGASPRHYVVSTFDVRAGPRFNYDGTARLLGFVPLSRRWSIVAGPGFSGGNFLHRAYLETDWIPPVTVEPVMIRELRAHGLLGFSFFNEPPDKARTSETILFVEPVVVVGRQADPADYNYVHKLSIIGSFAITWSMPRRTRRK